MIALPYHRRKPAIRGDHHGGRRGGKSTRERERVIRRSLSKMVLYGYAMSTTSKVIYSVRGFFGVPKDTGSVIVPTGSVLFPPKP
jgi:hypothetical protein